MKRILLLQCAAVALVGFSGPVAPVAGKIKVVATTPDLAALAREIGGDLVEVTSLAKPTEDTHFVDAKPSHIVTLNRADVLIEGGAELELGWLPPLLESARNPKIAPGMPGRIVASQGIAMLEVPTSFDRSKGDVHAMGNPHFLVDPLAATIVAAEIADHLAQVAPASAPVFKANLKRFDATLETKLAEWHRLLGPYRGARIVTYHKDFIYLAARFDLNVVQTLEPKPGIAPSPSHLAQVISGMKAAKARVILVQSFQNRKTAETVARQTNGIVLDISQQPGVAPNTNSYFELMDFIVRTLATALGATK